MSRNQLQPPRLTQPVEACEHVEVRGPSEGAQLVRRVAGISPALEAAQAPPGSVGRPCPDLTRLRRLTGYEPVVPPEEGVRRTFESPRPSRSGRRRGRRRRS